MTAPDRLALTDRKAGREAELRELAALMRERGGLAALPPPTPLHKMAAAAHGPRTSPHTRGGASTEGVIR